jgi:hypothetical protein
MLPWRWIVFLALAFLVCAIHEKIYYDSERWISALGLTSHRGAPPFEHARSHIAISGVAFRIRKFALDF